MTGVRRRELLGLAALAALPLGGCASRAAPPQSTTAPGPSGTAQPTGGPAATATTRPVVTSGGGPVPYRPGTVLLGSYLGLKGKSLRESLAQRRRELGRDPGILHLFYGWSDSLPRSVPELPESTTLLLSWRGTYYDEVNDGYWDRHIAATARRLADHRRPVLLRWGWEMNGDWYRWGGDSNGKRTSAYVKVWKRLRRIFDEEGAGNVSWVWSPNWNSSPNEPWNRMSQYYPGDRYVDWVGVSGYNFGKEAPGELFGGIYDAYSARKPIMITEVGALDRGGRTKADWITRFGTWVQEHPAVGGVVWFDTDTHPGSEERWRIDSDRDALAAYRAMANDPLFTG